MQSIQVNKNELHIPCTQLDSSRLPCRLKSQVSILATHSIPFWSSYGDDSESETVDGDPSLEYVDDGVFAGVLRCRNTFGSKLGCRLACLLEHKKSFNFLRPHWNKSKKFVEKLRMAGKKCIVFLYRFPTILFGNFYKFQNFNCLHWFLAISIILIFFRNEMKWRFKQFSSIFLIYKILQILASYFFWHIFFR